MTKISIHVSNMSIFFIGRLSSNTAINKCEKKALAKHIIILK